jgi:hypothetical protein
MSASAAPSLPCRRSTAAHTGFSPPARKFSGCRLASGRKPCPSTASSRTGGPPPSSQRSRLQEAGRELADIFFSSSTPGSRLGPGSCSGANVRVIYLEKSPKMCGWKICVNVLSVISPVLFWRSCLIHLTVYTVAYYLPGLYNMINFRRQRCRS